MTTQLSRALQPRHLSMIAIGGIIGAGLFVGSSAAIEATGPAIVLSYLLTGALILLVMRMIAEMAMRHPGQRAFTEFARIGLGRWAGFTVGWLYWYFWMVVVPIEALAGAAIIQSWLPMFEQWQIGLVLMALMTGVNLLSARSYAEVEFWFASIKVAGIIVFIVLAAAYTVGWTAPAGPTFGNLTQHGGFMPFGFVAVLTGATVVFFSLTGAEVVTIAAAESAEPSRAIAKMTTSIVVRILMFYVLSILLIVCVIPWVDVVPGEAPFTLALGRMGFGSASTAMSIIILTAVLSCLNSAFYVCSRLLLVLAEKGDAPQWLVKLNARRVPVRSVWASAIAGVLGVLAATASPGVVFGFLVHSIGALIVFIYIIVAFAQIRMRRASERAGEAPPPLTMWLFPWASYAAIAGMLAVLIAMAVTPARAKELYVSVLAFVVVGAAYLLIRRRE